MKKEKKKTKSHTLEDIPFFNYSKVLSLYLAVPFHGEDRISHD